MAYGRERQNTEWAKRVLPYTDWPNKVCFKVVKTIEVDGVEQAIESNLFVATKAA